MKYPAIWNRFSWGVVCGIVLTVILPCCIAMPVDVSSFDHGTSADVSWEVNVFLLLAGLTVLVLLIGMCACGDKPAQVSDPSPYDVDPSSQPLQQPNPGGSDSQSVGAHSPPLPTTPIAPPYQNVQGNGAVSAPPTPSPEPTEVGSPLTRAATIERQLPAIPPSKAQNSAGAARGSSPADFDADYDIIKTGKEPDYDGPYSKVKDGQKEDDTPSLPEGDYADVDMGRKPAVSARTGSEGRASSSSPKKKKVAPTGIAPRAEPETDISDAEYAVVDMKRTGSTASGRKEASEPYESLRGDEGGAVGGGAKPKKGKNHGYAKIDDVRGDNPGTSEDVTDGHMTSGGDDVRGASPVRSPRTPPASSPSHLVGSPSHQRRSLPMIDDSTLGAVGGQPPSPPPDAQAAEPQEGAERGTMNGTKRKEPSYSQVSARESLARVRAREQETIPPPPQLYQAVDEEAPMGGDDHSDLYESVDYQSVDGAQARPASFVSSRSNSTSSTLPARRARVYEEINDRDAARQAEGEDASIKPYAVVEPVRRRGTAPSRIPARPDSNCSDASDLYAKVDKPSKVPRGMSLDTKDNVPSSNPPEDFDDLYAKVDMAKKKRKAPPVPPLAKVKSFDEGTANNGDDSITGDGMYAEVKKPSKGSKINNAEAATTVGQANAEPSATSDLSEQDFDDSYQSIDDIRTNQRIDERAREVGMVHIDAVRTGPLVWEKPEHTYASVEEAESRRGQRVTTNGHSDQSREVNHDYEVLDKKAAKKAEKRKKKKGKEGKEKVKENSKENKKSGSGNHSGGSGGQSSPPKSPTKSPTKLNNKQLKVLADKETKETDL